MTRGGSTLGPGAGEDRTIIDPSTGEAAFQVIEADAALAAESIARARTAAPGWAARPALERGELLARVADRLLADATLPELLVGDVGKPLAEARAEHLRAARIFAYVAGLAADPVGELLEDAQGETVRVVRRPHGVALLITPWNIPLASPAWKLAPALLAGNAVVLKPAPAANRAAERLVAAVHDAGVPRDACLLVAGDAAPGEALLEAGADVISFTGSAAVGRRVAAAAARSMVPCQIEAGGKNAVYVSDAADIDQAARIILAGAMGYAGQKCTATSRALVPRSRADELLEALCDQATGLAFDDPRDERTVAGPMITAAARDRVAAELDRAAGRGVRVHHGGTALPRPGAYLGPTIVSGGPPDDAVHRDELFAPVVAVTAVDDLAAGIAEANATPYGLAAGIVSPLRAEVEQFIAGIDAGVIRVNAPTAGLEPHVPFGGTKASSLGPREQGRAGVAFFSETRTIYG
jgi:aldehyde dehydrogenase (NAD+)